jgi:hypothetical protein
MGGSTVILGIEIPSTNLVFLGIIAIHIPLGLACVIAGAVAMLNAKGRGRHSTAGRVYFWCLAALFVSATLLAVMRWAEDYHLFVFGALAFISAGLGRSAVRKALALLDADAYHGDGCLIYVDAGSLLRGQWAATATLESSSSFYVLAFTACCRVAFDYSRADEPSTPTVRRPCIVVGLANRLGKMVQSTPLG